MSALCKVYMHTICVPGAVEVRTASPGTGNEWLSVVMWLLGSEPRSSARASVL